MIPPSIVSKFITQADRHLANETAFDDTLEAISETLEWCMKKDAYNTPEAYLATWLALAVMCDATETAEEMLKEKLIAAAVFMGNPATEIMGEIYWADGYGDSPEAWEKPYTGTFGCMSDKQIFMFGFAHNAALLLPICNAAERMGLEWEYMKRLRRVRPVLKRVLESGDASPADNDALHNSLPSVYEHLCDFYRAYRVAPSEALRGYAGHERIAHLARWESPCFLTHAGKPFQSYGQAWRVAVLDAYLLFKETGNLEIFGPLLVALRPYEPVNWIAGVFQKALKDNNSYKKMLKSLPRHIIREERDKCRTTTHFPLLRRREMRHWYDVGEGKQHRAAIQNFMKILKDCARKLRLTVTSGRKTIYDFQRTMNSIPASGEMRERYDLALERLGRCKSYLANIVKVNPSHAAYAIYLFEHGLIDARWDESEIDTYVRYSYRI